MSELDVTSGTEILTHALSVGNNILEPHANQNFTGVGYYGFKLVAFEERGSKSPQHCVG
jgi:hypothetical protein